MHFKEKKKELDSMKNGVKLFGEKRGPSVIREEFNTLSTNIEFASADSYYQNIMVTSAAVSEGKSTIAANLAATFARQGQKTLLVDGDLRRPTVKVTFGINQIEGLTNFLTAKSESYSKEKIIYKTHRDNLTVIPSGSTAPSPLELLKSKKMNKLMRELSKDYDRVIYDIPPVLAVSDAQVLAGKVDGTILVVRNNHTEKLAVKQAVSQLQRVNGIIIGSVFNDVAPQVSSYYGYGYY